MLTECCTDSSEGTMRPAFERRSRMGIGPGRVEDSRIGENTRIDDGALSISLGQLDGGSRVCKF